jgi:hypothetical protein
VSKALPADLLTSSAALYPQSYNYGRDSVQFAVVTEEDLKRASFLDHRLEKTRDGGIAPWANVAQTVAASAMVERLGFIFHIGHVGSTLISRLLGEAPDLLSLREPTPLKLTAELYDQLPNPESRFSPAEFNARLDVWMKLWSRGFHAGQRPILKATSVASQALPALLVRPSRPPALSVTARLEFYLGGMLASDHAYEDARYQSMARLRRLNSRVGGVAWSLAELSRGEMLAMGWLTEMAALSAAAKALPDQIMSHDFDEFLVEPAKHLDAALRHFGATQSAADVEALIRGPLMRHYSKAPSRAYDASTRHAIAHNGQTRHAEEFARGMAWVEAAAKRYPVLADAIS